MNIFDQESWSHLAESDLAVVRALQDSPRAPWARVAQIAGSSPQTARRRWEKLVADGTAWITTYPSPASGVTAGLVELTCRPGTSDDVAQRLGAIPRIMTISAVTGDRDLVLSVVASDMREFRRAIPFDVAGGGDIVGVRSSLFTRVFHEGSSWRTDGDAQRTPTQNRDADEVAALPSAQMTTVLKLLEEDGRVPSRAVAEALDVSETHARRVIHRLTSSQQIVQRVDVSPEQHRWPHALVLWLVVPPAQMEAMARHLGGLPFTRAVAALAGGASNLYVVVWLRSLHEASAVEAQILAGHDARVVDRSVILHYHKRLGHLFDGSRRRIGSVGWSGSSSG